MEFWQWLRSGNNEACKVIVIIEAARLRRAGSRASQSTRNSNQSLIFKFEALARP